MKSQASLMTIVPAAGLTPGQAANKPNSVFTARSFDHSVARPEVCDQPAKNWLFIEDEFFPFDADGFEER
jgi:hypothetical protein